MKQTHLQKMIENAKRDKKVCALHAQGMTYKAIGIRYGFTAQWAHQICARGKQ